MPWTLSALRLSARSVSMLLTGAFAVISQKPPYERASFLCPEDQSEARVSLTWNLAAAAVEVTECDHWNGCRATCGQACLLKAAQEFPYTPGSTVLA